MSIPLETVGLVLQHDPMTVWTTVADAVVKISKAPLDGDVARQMRDREHAVGELDDLISTGAWDLWDSFHDCVPRTSTELKSFWQTTMRGKAILILDGLSFRELPHFIAGAARHGLNVSSVKATASEFPPETDPFANALGFSSRSALRSGGASLSFVGAKTTVSDMDWRSCMGWIGSEPDLIFWHEMPDERVHGLENDGDPFGRLSRELAEMFSKDDFWAFVLALTTGRTLVVTSDHGYAVGASFFEMPDGPSQFLRETFKARRCLAGAGGLGNGSPPLAIQFETHRGPQRMVLGRRKWKVPGGFPKLTHGGLTLFEVITPFIEISK